MKPIVKIGGVLIAIALLSMLFLNPRSCDPKPRSNGDRPAKKTCSIRSVSGSVASGDDIEFTMRSDSNKEIVDSLLYLDKTLVDHGAIGTHDIPLGRHTLKAKYLYADSSSCESTWTVEIRSDITPEVMGYDIVDMFDHDPASYTQGLTLHDERLFEGTGQYGESFIHNYAPGKKDYQARTDLPMDLFGEGITILGDKLYQLTWKAKKGFVYDISTMELLDEFDMPLDEGWGLTDDGSSLILSDGSNMLYYMDPVTFEITRKQAIYNANGPEKLINEMEYVNGYIYANIYGQPIIAKIDAFSGKTIAYIDCRGILPPEFNTAEQDVFNGIAFNPRRQTFYVTGKYWSKMFEIRLVDKST